MIRTPRMILALVVGGALLLSCSDDAGGPTDPGGDTGSAPVTQSILPGGGSITATTGNGTSVSLTFPAGAVGSPLTVTLRPVDAAGGAFFGMLLEPAGIIFLDEVAVTVTVPDGVDFTDQHLFFGDPADPVLIPTTPDAGARTLATSIRSFGIPTGDLGIATSAPRTQTQPGNNLGAMPQRCTQILARAQADFDNFIAQENFEGALQSALSSAALLQQAACPAGAQQWLDTVDNTVCTRFQGAVTTANQASITQHGDFENYANPVINWAGIAAQLSPSCPAHDTYTAALDALIVKFVAWHNQRLASISGPDLQTFSDLKQELVQVVALMEKAMVLGLNDSAEMLEDKAFDPTLIEMRKSAYGLGENDNWHFALTKLVTWGFFAGRDIIGIADPRLCDNTVSPPKCYAVPQQFGFFTGGPFTNDDIYNDIQFCATDIEFITMVASDTLYASKDAGGEGSPGQKTDAITIQCPTRGTIQVDGKIGTFTCFLTDDDADSEIVFKLNGIDVLGILRPSGADNYLDGTPAQIDIIQAAADAGITPKGGDTHDLTIVRKRRNCSDQLWGEQEFTLLTAALQWVNPTLEVEVNMPQQVDPGQTVNVDVRVKVIDQLGKAGFFDAIDVVLQSAGGTLQQLSGQTDSQGYFQTQLTADSGQPVAGANGAPSQVIRVDATATSFEGVTAQGSATAGAGNVGYARVVSVDYGARARAGGFTVFDDKEDGHESTSADSWSFSATAQADSSHNGKTFDGNAAVDASIELTTSGDTLTTISGSVSGSAYLVADGAFTAVEYPEAVHDTQFYVEIEVLDGPVGVVFDATTSASDEYRIEFDLAGGGYGVIPDYETPPANFHNLWGLGPGTHTFILTVYNRARCCCCTVSGSADIDFTIEIGGPPLGGS